MSENEEGNQTGFDEFTCKCGCVHDPLANIVPTEEFSGVRQKWNCYNCGKVYYTTGGVNER